MSTNEAPPDQLRTSTSLSPGDPCPRCGSQTRLTTYKKGPKAGRPLLVCSDYSCPTLIDLDEGDQTPYSPVAGESAQAEFERKRAARIERLRKGAPFLAAMGLLAAGLGFFVASAFVDTRLAAAVGVGTIVLFMWLIDRQTPEIVDWQHGAEAERRVGASLQKLESLGFVTLYDRRLKGRGGNIDSVTIGPTGVFVVETKYRKRGVEVINGRFEVGGREQEDAIRQVRELAMLVQVTVAEAMNRHRLTVVPVICIGNRKVDPARASGIRVVGVEKIAEVLASGPQVLDPPDVQELARILDNALSAYERRT